MAGRNDKLTHAVRKLESLQRAPGRQRIDWNEEEMRDELLGYARRTGIDEHSVEQWMVEIARAAQTMRSSYEQLPWFLLSYDIVQSIQDELKSTTSSIGKDILFGSLGTGDVNGQAIGFRNAGYYIVLIDDGTFTFANLLAKAVASCMPLAPGGGTNIVSDLTAIHRWINADPNSHVRLAEVFIYYAVAGDPNAAPPYDGSKEYEALTVALRDAMEFFIVAHEFGHAHLGHIDAAMHSLVPHKKYFEVGVNWKQEFEADCFGLGLALKCLNKRQPNASINYAGIELFFHSMNLLYRTIARFAKKEHVDEGSPTHPPVGQRVANLRCALKELMTPAQRTDAVKLASSLATLLDWMADEIERQVDIAANDGATLHKKWVPKQRFRDRILLVWRAIAAKIAGIWIFCRGA